MRYSTIIDRQEAEALRAVFDAAGPPTIGVEEELMLLDPGTLDLEPRAADVLAATGGDARFKAELPAAQLEAITGPVTSIDECARQLLSARAALAEAARPFGLLAAAGTHPFASAEGALNGAERYRRTREEYGPVAHRQLVFGLHVHVRVPGAERALAVHNALRSYLPELAALAANAPFHDGRDTGLASIRPKISEMLPRQGVPPPVASFEELAGAYRWGASAGALPERRYWWWELRLHPFYGTVEVRVPDQQTTPGESACVAAVAQALVTWLGARHDAGEFLPVHPTWRIAENRWSVCRHGLEGTLADLDTGEPLGARERLRTLIEVLERSQSGSAAWLGRARALVERNGAERQREVAAGDGLAELTRWLAQRLLAD